MKDVCAVLTYKRDPLLYLCLEAIRKNDANIPLILVADRGHTSVDLTRMATEFDCDLYHIGEHQYFGNSLAVFLTMHRALSRLGFNVQQSGDDIVHFIEDDTILHAGYFDWARYMLKGPLYSVALARYIAYPAATWYESPCASWNAVDLHECLSLIPPDYTGQTTREAMQKIADAAFPNSKYRFGSAEQDGFFLRAIEHLKLKTAFPEKSFASHIGWYGYNRPPGQKAPDGDFEQQVAYCRALLKDKRRRMELFGENITQKEMEGM